MSRATAKVVGISEMQVSDDPEEVLVTYSLGSCIGLSLYDPVAQVGGLLHSMMPLSSADPIKAGASPAMYTDTGVMALLQALFDLGATRTDLIARVAGAATQMDRSQFFRIGERNYMIARKVLWKNEILLWGKDVGGTDSRTMFLEMSTGRTLVKANGCVTEI